MVGTELALGSIFARDFRVESTLGGGGMGSVFAVRQLSTGHRRALKVMHLQLALDENNRARFTTEARIGSRIPSDYVVEVVAAGVDDATRMPWLAMELLDGENLQERVRRGGPLGAVRTIELFEQLGHALAAAHAQGVVHRDLKPENLFLGRVRRVRASEQLKVLDFGIAKSIQNLSGESTATAAMGTPLWMAPEQMLEQARISSATDVWAVGLLAFWALTGRPYWRAADPALGGVHRLLAEIGAEPLVPATERARELGLAPALPVGFDEWFASCVNRDPHSRPSDGGTACARLVALLEEDQAARGDERAPVAKEMELGAAASQEAPSDLELAETHFADEPAGRRPRSERPPPMVQPSEEPRTSDSEPARAAPGSSASEGVADPVAAMELIEVRRTRTFAWLTVMLVVLVFLALAVIDAPPVPRFLHAMGIAPTGLYSAWLGIVLRDESRFRSWMAVVFAAVIGIGCASTLPFWGVFSSAVAVMPICLSLFASGTSRPAVIAAFLGSAGPHAVIGLLVVSGLMADEGIIRPVSLHAGEALIVLGIAQVLFVIAYVLARSWRKATEDGLRRLEQATRRLAVREALLQEARQDLDRALKVGGPGRFSEQTVGSFKLGNLLGRGGMGEVYEAAHVSSGEPAAVKLLSASAAREPEALERFAREVKIAAALDVPNVVRVLETSRSKNAMPYLAMERLRGSTLADMLRERSRLSLDETVALVVDVARGLAAAHAAGIVHRDLKPQNLFAHGSPSEGITWKVLDFGVSRLVGAETITGEHILGTPAYMSPEQAVSAKVDERADLYSLGVVAYRAVTGRPPFAGSDAAAILFGVASRMPPAPSSFAAGHRGLDTVLAVAMAKDPALRFQSADEMGAAFVALARGEVAREHRARAKLALARFPWGAGSRVPASEDGRVSAAPSSSIGA